MNKYIELFKNFDNKKAFKLKFFEENKVLNDDLLLVLLRYCETEPDDNITSLVFNHLRYRLNEDGNFEFQFLVNLHEDHCYDKLLIALIIISTNSQML